jgi:hypothetical protein
VTAINNRKYTGLLRTPSSLAWLIKKRASTVGEIERKTRRINTFRSERDELNALLKHIDGVIRQHEVGLNPEVVDPRPPRRQALGGYGEMGRFVLASLRVANGQPTSTTNLAIGYIQHLKLDVTMLLLRDVRQRLRHCMIDLASKGKAEPRHIVADSGKILEGRWVLKASDS